PLERVEADDTPREPDEDERHAQRGNTATVRLGCERDDQTEQRRDECRRRGCGDPVGSREADTRSDDEERRPAGDDEVAHGGTRSRNCSMRAGPMPGIASRSSTDVNGPWVWRQSTIFSAVTGPTPGSSSSWSTVATARLTLPGPAPTADVPTPPPAPAGTRAG